MRRERERDKETGNARERGEHKKKLFRLHMARMTMLIDAGRHEPLKNTSSIKKSMALIEIPYLTQLWLLSYRQSVAAGLEQSGDASAVAIGPGN